MAVTPTINRVPEAPLTIEESIKNHQQNDGPGYHDEVIRLGDHRQAKQQTGRNRQPHLIAANGLIPDKPAGQKKAEGWHFAQNGAAKNKVANCL